MRPTFIKLGNIRIKLSNIKNYGISYTSRERLKIISKEEFEKLKKEEQINNSKKRLNKIKRPKNIKEKILKKIPFRNIPTSEYQKSYEKYREEYTHRYQNASAEYKKNYFELENYSIPYLYITTYQNDNYKFHEDKVSFNVRDKMKELDKYLT